MWPPPGGFTRSPANLVVARGQIATCRRIASRIMATVVDLPFALLHFSLTVKCDRLVMTPSLGEARLSGRFDHGTCLRCGLLQLEQIPPGLRKSYSGYERHDRDSPVRRFFGRAVTWQMLRLPADVQAHAYWNIGCGNGWYMQAMARSGWLVTGVRARSRICPRSP